MCAKFDQNERIGPIESGRSKSSANVSSAVSRQPLASTSVPSASRARTTGVGRNGDEVRRDADRARARAAAAVRNRKRLVHVEVHEVEAHVARTRVAHQRVGVRAVVVHQAAGVVHGVRDLVDVRLRTAPACSGWSSCRRRCRARRPCASRRDRRGRARRLERDDFEAAHRRRSRIRAVRGVGHDDVVALRLAASS